jgi:hypothetical protein
LVGYALCHYSGRSFGGAASAPAPGLVWRADGFKQRIVQLPPENPSIYLLQFIEHNFVIISN